MIVQPRLVVPPDIAADLASGALVLTGGVVRDLAGRIVKHLDEVPAPSASAGESQAVQVAEAGARRLQLNSTTKTAIAATTVVVIVGGAIFLWRKRRRPNEAVVEPASDYSEAWRIYLAAASEGRLNVSIIDRLIRALDAVMSSGEVVSLGLSAGQSANLVELVADHTKRLVEAAGGDSDAPELTSPSGSPLVAIRRYLVIQERVLGAVPEA